MFKNNEIEIEVSSFKAEYARCGSHRILLTLNVDDYDLPKLIEQLKQIIKINKE